MHRVGLLFAIILSIMGCPNSENEQPSPGGAGGTISTLPIGEAGGSTTVSGTGGLAIVDAAALIEVAAPAQDTGERLAETGGVPDAPIGDGAIADSDVPTCTAGSDQLSETVVFVNGMARGVMSGWAWPTWGQGESLTDPPCNPGNIQPDAAHSCEKGVSWNANDKLCVTGTVPVFLSSLLSENWGLGISVAADECGGVIPKSFTSMAVIVTGIPDEVLSYGVWVISLHRKGDPEEVMYQVRDNGKGEQVPFSQFNTQWWDPVAGTYFQPTDAANIDRVEVDVMASERLSVTVTDLCLTKIIFGGRDTPDGSADVTADGNVLTPPPPSETCSDGILEGIETCDDGNLHPYDGCNENCQTEIEYICPVPGEPCINLSVCGDGILNHDEECDDGNQDSGDGCAGDCRTIERLQ